MKRRRQTGRARPRPAEATPRPQGGAELEVEIERILPGGLGLAHAEGKTVLVALAAPGDRLRVRIERTRGGVAFASVVEVVEPSPQRIEPPCAYFGRCGGCDFQQLSYAAQLEAKSEIIRDCLRRIARVEPPAEIPVTPAPREWRYRSRAQWQHDPVRLHLGYFERGTHRVVDVAECPVVTPELQGRLEALRAQMRDGALPEAAQEFAAAAGDGGLVTLTPPVEASDERESVRAVAGERYRFDAACFFQINHDLLEPLVRRATEGAGGALAVDLYCGVGLFTLPLARRFGKVVGVEGHAAACGYARRNLADANLANARVETAHVGEWLNAHARELAPADFVLLDPPRAGADGGALEGVIDLQARHISYVSCDPATLARDLRDLFAAGYRLDTIEAFDLFPQTHHVETLARLTRHAAE